MPRAVDMFNIVEATRFKRDAHQRLVDYRSGAAALGDKDLSDRKSVV